MVPDPLKAMLKEGKAANGSLGEGEATTDFRKRGLGVGLSKDREMSLSARAFFGRPGDQRVPSILPNTIGGVGDLMTSCFPADGDNMSLGSKETDSQNAWLRRADASSSVRLRGGGLVIVTRGDS